MVLSQFIFAEKLRINDEDIEAAIDERVAQFSDNEALQKGMRDYYHQGLGFEMLSSEVLMNKAYVRIEAVLTGTAPDLAELEAEAAAEAAAETEAEAAEMVEDGEETETAVTETTPDTEAEIEETAEPEAVAVSADEDVKEDEAE